MNAIIYTLRSLEGNPCANASSLWLFDFNTLSFFLSSLPAAFVNTIFATFLLLFIVTVFSIFV